MTSLPLMPILLTAVVLTFGWAVVPARADADSDLKALFEEHEQWTHEVAPETALRRGDLTASARLTDVSLSAIDARHAMSRRFLESAGAIDADSIADEQLRVSLRVFVTMLETEVGDYAHRVHLMSMNQRWGPHQIVAQLNDGVPLRNETDWNRYLQRLEAAPTYLEQSIAVLAAGLEAGLTPPGLTLVGVPAQLDALVADDGLAMLSAPLVDAPKTLTRRARSSLERRLTSVIIPNLRRALERYRAFIVDDYLPGCRTTIAARDLPGGEAFYAHRLASFTTSDMTPREVHELGLYEVQRLRGEMILSLRKTDYLGRFPDHSSLDDDELLVSFISSLRSDRRFYVSDPDVLVDRYKVIAKTIDARLPQLFRTLPRLPYGVREIPAVFAPQQTTAYYQPGNLAAGEPGWFNVNTYALDQRPTYEMVALTLHEAVPGHHLQAALAAELDDLPAFRRDLWFTAYGEGWALYAERLGIEMGMYDDPYDNFGRLLYEMWRACRLVVDPGIHALSWSREDAVDFMRRNTALSVHNIETEVDRYIAWPGQACAYKIGELRIRELRSRSEKRLGAAFDVREFHDIVLGAGSVPLDVLEERVDRWLRKKPIGAAYD